jgi:hypothetical protein
MTLTPVWASVALAFATVFSQGQGKGSGQGKSSGGRPSQSMGSASVSVSSGYPVYGGYGNGGAISGAGDRMRGMADVIRAQNESLGQLRVQTAQAATELEAAKARNIENQQRATEVYFEKRRLNQESQAAEAEAQRQRAAARRSASESGKTPPPPRPSAVQFDPVTGRLRWPAALKDDRFADVRDELDKMFEHRAAADGYVGDEDSQKIQEAVKTARDQLRENIKAFSSQDYVQATKFLDALDQERQFAGR